MADSHLGQLWFVEDQSEGVSTTVRLDKVLFQGKSDFQKVDVYDTAYGLTLVLDGKLQSAECDEVVYHESLVHPAMVTHPTGAKKVYIGGGGEGATAREVLRFNSVESLTMVDIDPFVIETSKKFLKQHSGGAFEDPRMNLVVGDCKKYLEDHPEEKYDVIIMDLADPMPDGPCWFLYTKSFYQFLKSRLNPGGIIVTQSGPSGIRSLKDVFTPVVNTCKQVFDHVVPYSSLIVTFTDSYGFTMMYESADCKRFGQHSPEEYDALVSERLTGEPEFMDGLTTVHVSTLTKYQRVALAAEKRTITEDAGAFMYV